MSFFLMSYLVNSGCDVIDSSDSGGGTAEEACLMSFWRGHILAPDVAVFLLSGLQCLSNTAAHTQQT